MVCRNIFWREDVFYYFPWFSYPMISLRHDVNLCESAVLVTDCWYMGIIIFCFLDAQMGPYPPRGIVTAFFAWAGGQVTSVYPWFTNFCVYIFYVLIWNIICKTILINKWHFPLILNILTVKSNILYVLITLYTTDTYAH